MLFLRTAGPRALRTGAVTVPRPLAQVYAARGMASTARTAAPNNISSKDAFDPYEHGRPRFQMPISTPQTQSASDFPDLVNALTTSLSINSSASIPELTALLRSYKSDLSEFMHFAHANPTKQYTRNLVAEVPGVFNLLVLVWTPGKMSPIHDHADAHCLMKILKGHLVETRYAIPAEEERGAGPLTETSRKVFATDKVTYMADTLGLHSVANPSPTEYAVSLHLYTPPNAAMRGCTIFEADNGAAKHVKQGAYDSIHGIPQ